MIVLYFLHTNVRFINQPVTLSKIQKCLTYKYHKFNSHNIILGGPSILPQRQVNFNISLADLRGSRYGPKRSNFHAVFGNFGKIVCCRPPSPPPRGAAPLLRGILDAPLYLVASLFNSLFFLKKKVSREKKLFLVSLKIKTAF